jgi:hypothetical protein
MMQNGQHRRSRHLNEQQSINQSAGKQTGLPTMSTKERTMKISKLIQTAAFAATALLAQIPLPARALDAWQTVNDWKGLSGYGCGSLALQTDASGTLLLDAGADAFGNSNLGTPKAIVRGSADQGANWTILDSFYDPSFQWAAYRSIACDAANRLYGAGLLMSQQPTTKERWFIRESADGANWAYTDILDATPPSTIANCAAIRVAPSGDVYAAGICSGNWTVRKKAVGGSSYTTVDSLPASSGDQAAEGMAFHSTAGVFVVGKTTVNGIYQWLVRRSLSGQSGTWSTVDTFVRDQNWTKSQALCVAVDGAGQIYVAGEATYQNRTTVTDYWLVRRSADGGNTWTTVDQWTSGSLHRPWAMTMTTDTPAKILVCGYVDTANGRHWIVRKGTPGTSTVSWITSDDFQFGGLDSRSTGIAVDAWSNVYVTGGGPDNWMTRKLAPGPQLEPPTVTVTAPLDGATVARNANLTVTAAASDTDGHVVSVQFYVNGQLCSTDTTAPYSCVFKTAPQRGVNYTIYAIATDDSGLTTQSASVTVTTK